MPATDPGPWWARISARDPGGLAFARAVRATIVGPAIFAIALEVFDDPAVATMAMFGSISALVFADFGGPAASRVRAYLALGAVGAGLLALGTLVSGSTAWSVPLTFVICGLVRFLGNLGPRWSASVSPLILSFVLGALVPAPHGAIPGRTLGWGLAFVAAAVVSVVILPRRTSVRIETVAAEVTDELARVLRLAVSSPSDPVRTDLRDAVARARHALRPVSLMPVRPSGPGAHDMARRQILDRLTRLARLLEVSLDAPAATLSEEMEIVGDQAADVLELAAEVLRGRATVSELDAATSRRHDLRDAAFARLQLMVASGESAPDVLGQIDAGFVARVGAWHAEVIAGNVAFLQGEHVPIGDGPHVDVPDPSLRGALDRFDRFVGVHGAPGSVWFRDALRAGISLAAAVLLARLLNVDHAFWVALGTLSVLRSSALATGQSAVVGALGTGVGFGVSSALLALVGFERPGLFVLLVLGVIGSAYLPQVVGFGTGQAAFTVMVVVLFNLVEPDGWHTGLTRFEDVLIGTAVSTVVAALFWPRRLEPLVSRLVAESSDASGALLQATVGQANAEEWENRRRQVLVAETRARAALVEMVAQQRSKPEVAEPWIARFGVASHVRSACDAMRRYDVLLTGPPNEASHELDADLGTVGSSLAVDLAPGRGAAPASRGDAVAAQTKREAEAAIEECSDDSAAVVRALLTRDWLITVGMMLESRP